MAPREAKAIVYLTKYYIFPAKETLSKLYKVGNFILVKEFMQKW